MLVVLVLKLTNKKESEMQVQQSKIKRASGIVASVVISLSEIIKVYPEFKVKDIKTAYGHYTESFLELLQGLGLDTKETIREEFNTTHRNRFNEVVTCPKWSGEERQDDAWVNSGYASRAAKDKASGSLLVEASYRQRGETKDMQAAYNERDKNTEVDKTQWVD
jgi:hypothetical protein